MSERYRQWLISVLRWAQQVEHDAEQLADYIIETFAKGGDATTPPDTGT